MQGWRDGVGGEGNTVQAASAPTSRRGVVDCLDLFRASVRPAWVAGSAVEKSVGPTNEGLD